MSAQLSHTHTPQITRFIFFTNYANSGQVMGSSTNNNLNPPQSLQATIATWIWRCIPLEWNNDLHHNKSLSVRNNMIFFRCPSCIKHLRLDTILTIQPRWRPSHSFSLLHCPTGSEHTIDNNDYPGTQRMANHKVNAQIYCLFTVFSK